MTPGDRADVERFAVGGWVDPPMSQVSGRLLLLGEVSGPSLVYVGHVRLDSVRDSASRLWLGMQSLETEDCPFALPPLVQSVRWCRPGVAVDARFDGRNSLGRLRMPSLHRTVEADDAAGRELVGPGVGAGGGLSARRG